VFGLDFLVVPVLGTQCVEETRGILRLGGIVLPERAPALAPAVAGHSRTSS